MQQEVDDKMIADLNDLLTNQIGKEDMIDLLTGLYMDYSKLIIRNIKCQGEVELPADFDNQLSFLREIIKIFSGKYAA